jgi:F-type H+-transporting ATPase subunit gamma
LIPIGRRANDYFGKRGWRGSFRLPELGDQVDLAKAQALARHLTVIFAAGETDSVDLLYTKFITTGSRRIMQETLLPIVPESDAHTAEKDYIFEPSASAIFGDLLPRFVRTRVMTAMADSLASEHAARLVSMTAATKNAGEMITALTLIRNKLRQAAITKEISELVGGAEALR